MVSLWDFYSYNSLQHLRFANTSCCYKLDPFFFRQYLICRLWTCYTCMKSDFPLEPWLARLDNFLSMFLRIYDFFLLLAAFHSVRMCWGRKGSRWNTSDGFSRMDGKCVKKREKREEMKEKLDLWNFLRTFFFRSPRYICVRSRKRQIYACEIYCFYTSQNTHTPRCSFVVGENDGNKNWSLERVESCVEGL